MSLTIAESRRVEGTHALSLVIGIFPDLAGTGRSSRRRACDHRATRQGPGPHRGHALAGLVVSTAGIGFALDDPAAEIVASSPTSLGRRRLMRITIASLLALVVWTMIAIAVADVAR